MFSFFDLPREIRDMVYEINLVHGTIWIDTTAKFLHTSYGPLAHLNDTELRYYSVCHCDRCVASGSKGIERRDVQRTTYDELRTTGRSFTGPMQTIEGKRIESLQRTYCQIHFISAYGLPLDPQKLNIFLTNREIYHEASAIFYSKNKLNFGRLSKVGYSSSLAITLAFLQDRPKHALAHLRSVRFAVCNGLEHALRGEHCPHASELEMLCNILAYDCRLADLDLGIFGTCQSNQNDYLQRLYKIRGLKSLEVCIHNTTNNDESVKYAKNVIRTLRNKCLIGGEEMGDNVVFDGDDSSEGWNNHRSRRMLR